VTVLEKARSILDEGDICDGCLGRRFAELSYGLTSHERGKAVRVGVAMEKDEPYEAVPPEDCWVCDGEFCSFEAWAEQSQECLSGYDFETFLVGTRVPPLIEENERLLGSIHGDENAARFKSEFNREVGKRFGDRTGAEVSFEHPDVTVVIDLQNEEVETEIRSVYFYGRYRKLERGIAQTEWKCRVCDATGQVGQETCENCEGTGHVYDRSIEEELRPAFLEATEGTGVVFHGAGREDVDALMLGDGRPFVMEVECPRQRDIDVEQLQSSLNGSTEALEVRRLCHTDPDAPERVKGIDASKRYRAELEFSSSIDSEELKNGVEAIVGTVEQRTPERVDHRRADITREREVYEANIKEHDGDTASIEVHTEGGTYIKELVSGDEGRTDPSLREELGTEATVEALDVLAVEADDRDLSG